MSERKRAWTLIFVFIMPILVEQICLCYPDSSYCQTVDGYLRDPEPVSANTLTDFSMPSPSAAPYSGTTTTTF